MGNLLIFPNLKLTNYPKIIPSLLLLVLTKIVIKVIDKIVLLKICSLFIICTKMFHINR